MAGSTRVNLFLKSACSVPIWYEWWRDYTFSKKGHTNQRQIQGRSLGMKPFLFHFLHCQILEGVAIICCHCTTIWHFSPHLVFGQHFGDVASSGLFESFSTDCCDSLPVASYFPRFCHKLIPLTAPLICPSTPFWAPFSFPTLSPVQCPVDLQLLLLSKCWCFWSYIFKTDFSPEI